VFGEKYCLDSSTYLSIVIKRKKELGLGLSLFKKKKKLSLSPKLPEKTRETPSKTHLSTLNFA
jgi:hypothetical protein